MLCFLIKTYQLDVLQYAFIIAFTTNELAKLLDIDNRQFSFMASYITSYVYGRNCQSNHIRVLYICVFKHNYQLMHHYPILGRI